MEKLSVPQLLAALETNRFNSPWIDVRSELEFERGAIPGTVNLPLLYQSERHEIGLKYKHEGQEAAIKLGEELVGPHQSTRIAAWLAQLAARPGAPGLLMCWRGGLRSQISCEWLEAASQAVWQLEGGYKAVRRAFLQVLEAPPPLIVLQGLTGSGKTEILRSLSEAHLDLEAAARHRGSAFGAFLEDPQPAQATFENELALQVIRQRSGEHAFLVEDESRMLGVLSLPDILMEAMRLAPVIVIEESLAARSARIYREYIEAPLAENLSPATLEAHTLKSFGQIEKRLDKEAARIRQLIKEAFQGEGDSAKHQAWISYLLQHYYDKRYHHASTRHPRRPLFVGDGASCRAWFIEHGRRS